MSETPETTPPESIECRPTNDPAVRSFIVATMLIGFGAWCWMDRANYPPPEAWNLNHINDAVTYALNNWGPFLFVPVGTLFAALGIRHLLRKLIADDEGIGYVGRAKVLWTEVTSLDVSRLKDKGLLTLRYGDGGKLKLDSWYLRDFRKLVSFIERHLPNLTSQAQPAGPQDRPEQ